MRLFVFKECCMGSLSGTNGKSKPKRKPKDDRPFRYINHDLSKSQQEDLQGLFEAGEWGEQDIDKLVGEGYAYKLSRDTRGGGFRAHLIDTEESSPDYNACLAGRGATPAAARYALLYRHFVLAPDGWGVLDSSSEGTAFFG
jgi:hypothetical protein